MVLLSTAGLEAYDVSDRERWEGIVLREDEAYDALDHLDGAIINAAAHAGGRLPRRKDGGDE